MIVAACRSPFQASPKKVLLKRWHAAVAHRAAGRPDQCTAIVDLARRQLWSEALLDLHGLLRRNLSPAAVCYNSVMSACSKKQRWAVAIEVLDLARRNLVDNSNNIGKLGTVACNIAMTACGRGACWEGAWALLAEMRRDAIHLDTAACNAAVTALGRGGQWQLSLFVFNEMDKQDDWPSPDVISYNAVLSALMHARWPLALALLQQLRSNSNNNNNHNNNNNNNNNNSNNNSNSNNNNNNSNKNNNNCTRRALRPDIASFGACLHALSVGQQWARCLALLSELQRSSSELRLRPDLAAFGSSIASCQGAQWPWALLLLGSIRKSLLRADSAAFGATISACASGLRWQRALLLLGDMRQLRLR
ncbi:unnamed protein product, partial [Polarella glacialis]